MIISLRFCNLNPKSLGLCNSCPSWRLRISLLNTGPINRLFGIRVDDINEFIIIHEKVVCRWLPTLISFITVGNCFICQAHHQACLEIITEVIRLDMGYLSLDSMVNGTYNEHERYWNMHMTASSKKEFIKLTIFVKQSAKYSTSKYRSGIQFDRPTIMAKGLSISGFSNKSQCKFSTTHLLSWKC